MKQKNSLMIKAFAVLQENGSKVTWYMVHGQIFHTFKSANVVTVKWKT